jgi:AraC family transcriptional regulator
VKGASRVGPDELSRVHLQTGENPMPTTPSPSVSRRVLTPQPILFIRRQVARKDLAAALGECFGAVAAYCRKAGLALAGPPFARYPSSGPGDLTMEAGMPIAAPAPGEGEIEAGFLQGGAVAFAVHAGAYNRLPDTFKAIEAWMAESDERPGGAPWESYITDPADYRDSADWRTEVYWPLEE